MLVHWIALLVWFALSVPQSVHANTVEGREAGTELFRDGVQAFQSGDPQAARDRFERAIAAGFSSPSLFYNLGVACYQLGDFPAAASAFKKLLAGPDDALARYNLGLVALAQKDHEKARLWFAQVAQGDTPDKLRTLATRQLASLREPGPASRMFPETRGYLALSGGYDSNIAGLPDASATSEGGTFMDVLASGSYSVPAGRQSRLSLDAAAYTRKYPSDSDYDGTVVQGRAGWAQSHGSGEHGARVFVSQSWFAGERLERRLGVEGYHGWDGCPLPVPADWCGAALAAASVSGGGGFEAYDGQWYRLRLEANRRVGQWRFEGDYQLEINNRRDLRTAGHVISVSPVHHGLDLAALYAVRPGLAIGALGAYRHSRYQDAHTVAPSAGESGRRQDNRLEAGMLLERALNNSWLLRAEWRLLENQSSLAQYEYQRQTLMVTLEGVL